MSSNIHIKKYINKFKKCLQKGKTCGAKMSDDVLA